jgi:hypothetical protein
MTQRSPLYGRVGPREHPRNLLTWTNGVQQGLQPIPFIQRQWDWPNPLPYRQNPALLDFTVAPQIAVQVVVSLPFNQASWPNPPLRAQNPDLRTWFDSIPQTALSLTLPPRQTEWPNPVTARSIDRTWTYSQQIPAPVVVAMPVQVTDWPNPVARARATLSWSCSIQQGLQPTPFIARQSDWPNPVPARRNLEPLSWSFKLQIPPAVASPFNQSNWPNPPQKPPNLSLRSWAQSLSVPAVGRPVRQLDWPNPGQPRRALALLVDYTPNMLVPGITPAPVVVETPRRRGRIIVDKVTREAIAPNVKREVIASPKRESVAPTKTRTTLQPKKPRTIN